MSHTLFNQIVSLGATLLITLLVLRYYRTRTYPFTQRYSTFGPRFWAGPVDSCVLWPVSFIANALVSLRPPKGVAAALVVIESLAWLVYTVLMHAKYGQTIGKMVCKVRVVDYHTEGKISVRQAWLREGIPALVSFFMLGWQVFAIMNGRLSSEAVVTGEFDLDKASWLVATLPSLWFLAEVLTMLTNQKRRALHDFIAGTVVVRLNAQAVDAQQNAELPNHAFGRAV